MKEENQKSWMIHFISIILIMGIFAIACLLLTNIGLSVYKRVVVANNDNFELRTSLMYVATKVRQSDMEGYPYIINKDGVSLLVLGEEEEGNIYETLIYHKDNALYEIYQEKGAEFELDFGMKVMDIKNFTFQLKEDKMLEIQAENNRAEQENLTLSLRTGRQ